MAISESLSEWAARPVTDWMAGEGITDPAGTAYRLRFDSDEKESGVTWSEVMSRLLADPRIEELQALVIGDWCEGYDYESSAVVVESLVSASPRLRALTALFFGDITYEECEISWIQQSDISSLFGAYPQLEHLGVRGGQDLSLGRPHQERLKTLIVQTGGLPVQVVQEIVAAELPALEHLEIWLGEENYGGTSTLEDLEPIFQGTNRWPRLKYLGICNCTFADELAQTIVTAPILSQLEVLDLSLGTLGDEGAAALAESPAIARLKKLDIHHHYVSPEGVARLLALGIEVDATDVQEPSKYDGERYIAVSE